MKSGRAAAGLVTVLLLAVAGPVAAAPPEAPGPWPDELRDLVATLPVQSEGRVKPLSTWAAFTLLRMNHRRACDDEDGRSVDPVGWLLDAWLRPERARRHRCFLVETREVLDAVGLTGLRGKKRDRYSFADLQPGRERLATIASRLAEIDERERTPVEEGLVKLAHDVAEFEWLLGFLDFGRERLPAPASPRTSALFGDRDALTLTEVVAAAPALRADDVAAEDARAVAILFDRARALGARGRVLALLPPDATRPMQERWLSPSDVVRLAVDEGQIAPVHLVLLEHLRALPALRDDPTALTQRMSAFHAHVRTRAEARGEYDRIELEVDFYRLDPFTKSLALYVLAFLLVAVGWLLPRARWPVRAAAGVLVAALALHTLGIVLRCVIRGRPPISTLYETVLFVTACAVLAGLVLELVARRRVALSLIPVLGALGLFVAGRYEVIGGTDTMPQLVAVLDTNFWLATHVTCVTIGYAAALLAAAMANVHLLGRAFGLKRDDPDFYRGVASAVYGTIGFGLVFAVVGTLLGGIWANDSWGRFWGWDPKENGALLIVLVELAILHARLGGYVKGHGLCMAAVLLGGVVAFSWWGVNLLGVGLHSYGFASGVWSGLKLFYAIEAAVFMTGVFWWLQERRAAARPDARGPSA